MSTHTVIRPAYEGMPTPIAEGFQRRAVTCMTCLLTFTVWQWEGAKVTLEHQGNGNDHLERHSKRAPT